MKNETLQVRGSEISIDLRREIAVKELRNFLTGHDLQSPRDQVFFDATDALIASGNFLLLDAKIKEEKSAGNVVDINILAAHKDAHTERNRARGIIENKSSEGLSDDSGTVFPYCEGRNHLEPKLRLLTLVETDALLKEKVLRQELIPGVVALKVGSVLQSIRTENITQQLIRSSI